MSAVAVGSAVAGAVVTSAMNDGGGGGSTTSSGSSAPWEPMQKYLVGGTQGRRLRAGVQPIYSVTGGKPSYEQWIASNPGRSFWEWSQLPDTGGSETLMNPASDYETYGQKGIADIASELYGTTGMTPEQQDWLRNQQGMAEGFYRDPGLLESIWENGRMANSGTFDTNVSPASMVDLQGARRSQGALDPTDALGGILSGRVNTSTLDPVLQNATQRLTQNFNEQVMPGIDTGAIMAGQYGGSRQGVAQGIASRGLAQSIGDMYANMYNDAYQNAQQRQYGAANALNQQAQQNAQFNSDLTLRNNAQTMAQAQQNLNNKVVGSNLITGGMNALNTNFANGNQAYDNLRNAPWEDLARYQSVIQPIAGMGNTNTQSSPYYTNPVGNIMGGALTGYRIGQNLGFGGSTPSNQNNPMWDAYSGFDNPDNYG